MRSPVPGDTLDVRYSEYTVGHLVRRSESVLDLEFRYSEAWLGLKGAFPVSLSMPLDTQAYGAQQAYPWFMNLLPEGRALQLIGNVLSIAEIDVFAMIEEMGGDLPGALEVRRHSSSRRGEKPSIRPLTEAELAECIRALPERPVLVGGEGITMSLAGAQDKLPVVALRDGRLALPLHGMPSTHILKPRNGKFRDSVPNEAYCLNLATAAGLDAAPVSLGRAEDIDYLLVKRYDRRIKGKTITRIHQEDLCQATGFPPYLKYEWNPEIRRHGPKLKDCMDVIGRTKTAGMVKMRFFDALLFNILAGNVDAHSKNYSLLLRDPGTVEMAQIYDVLNGDIYPQVTRNLAMKIAGKQRGGHLYGRHWDRFAQENGLSPTQVRHRVAAVSKAVLDKAPETAEYMGSRFGNAAVHREISGYVVDYCKNMLTNLISDPAPEADVDVADAPVRSGSTP
ncbi:type II toxin-antitoxin system HipA family toxin [Skermanella rosea]|uniref:type II toxin-antitoxin system HipA family toxin n=1 Tax=Skermanella rosea TaxID=1817965 RepID=UPI001932CAF3|nr:type II toxin-antitoxin system HipA family toxin [Skermanella rosea]UEM03360.1 type II toxin-antitoxin system HipA family toxin [Skermanella rosea]